MWKYVHALVCTCLFISFLSAQETRQFSIDIPQNDPTLSELISIIEGGTPFTFSYNSQYVEGIGTLQLPSGTYSLSDLTDIVESLYPVRFDINYSLDKIILTPSRQIRISGMVRDSLSGEGLPHVVIYHGQSFIGSTNQDGFFSIAIPTSYENIIFSYLGYHEYLLDLDGYQQSNDRVILMSNRNIIDRVVITSNLREFNHLLPENQILPENIAMSQSITGHDDLYAYLRMLPGVSVGSEGQNGLVVRGGGPDKNLVLLDGVAVYEASHLGGLNSIFISDAIKNVSFHKSGIPVWHDGKLASVIDVQLKDGSRNDYNRSLTVGLEGIQGHLDGPLGKNTSINLNGKFSWFSVLASPLLENNLDFNNSTLRYNDGYAKISHWFSPTSRLSVSYYSGNDLIRLARNDDDTQSFSFTDVNRIEWGNRVLAVNWHQSLSDKWYLTSQLGISSFNYSSRGSYSIDYIENDTLLNNSFDILSNSDLQDVTIKNKLDYYGDDWGKLTAGIDLIRHKNEPSIIESEVFLDPDLIPATELDSTYLSNEIGLYLQHEYKTEDRFTFQSGLRLSYFGSVGKEFVYLLPRLRLWYESPDVSFGLSYSRMSQFIHLLVNPGPGLPSDLWVPSTEKVAPELSDLFSASLHYRLKSFLFGIHGFYNQYSNVIEYSSDSDILYSLIIDQELFNIKVNNTNWEERVSVGNGKAYGVELFTGFETRRWQANVSYTLSRSTRRFDDLNNGQSFPYKYDRRHNFSAQCSFKIGDHSTLSAHFVYGTGNAFTRATEEILDENGIPRLVPISRNNARVPAYHHLDLLYAHTKKFDDGRQLSYGLGIYNIYNRLNPFYVYLFQDPETREFDGFRKISIYPVIPKINLKYSW